MKGKLKKIYSLPLRFNLTYIHSTDPLSQYVDNQLQMSVREKSKFFRHIDKKVYKLTSNSYKYKIPGSWGWIGSSPPPPSALTLEKAELLPYFKC